MLEKLNDLHYCSKRILHINLEIFINLELSKQSNNISFACVNLLLNNKHNVECMLKLKIEVLEKLLFTIPSQMKTLLALNNFRMFLNKALELNPNSKKQYELIDKTEYKKLSDYLNNRIVETAKESLGQMQFVFN